MEMRFVTRSCTRIRNAMEVGKILEDAMGLAGLWISVQRSWPLGQTQVEVDFALDLLKTMETTMGDSANAAKSRVVSPTRNTRFTNMLTVMLSLPSHRLWCRLNPPLLSPLSHQLRCRLVS